MNTDSDESFEQLVDHVFGKHAGLLQQFAQDQSNETPKTMDREKARETSRRIMAVNEKLFRKLAK